MAPSKTLIKPPPLDPNKSAIENVLELTPLRDIDSDLFTNTRPLWHPPGARGIYGGAAIAQCLAAAQKTVPPDFTIHSMHCYFVLNGNVDIPIIYHVEHVREGRSFATRTVQARQRGKAIFTTTMSFVRENSGGLERVEHSADMPTDVPGPDETEELPLVQGDDSPFESRRIDILNSDSPRPQDKRTRQWTRARGTISPAGGHEAHLSALAYMSDNYFIGTVSRVHNLWRHFPHFKGRDGKMSIEPDARQRILEENPKKLERIEEGMQFKEKRPEVSMIVSLDHTIYFHRPREFRADEWIFTEMETPWAGDGRGLVFQKMFQNDRLIATCIQEGVVRLKQPEAAKL